MEKKIPLTLEHQRTWNELRKLKDGERILGSTLQQRIGVSDKRRFMAIIEDLRNSGMLISGSKSEPMGYQEIRNVDQLSEYLRQRRNEYIRGLRHLDKMEIKWFQDQAERMKNA